MAEKIGIALIDADENTRRFVKELVRESEAVRVVAEAADLGRGYDLARQHRPEIVILDLYPSVESALRLAERIVQKRPQTMIFATSFESDPETILKAMRAGAREFLSKPLRKEELTTALNAAVRALHRMAAGEGRSGKLISVFGVKGGVGTTMIAANLAVCFAGRMKREVALVDMNLQFGNSALFLNMNPRNTILDVARHITEIDPETLRDTLPRHSSGVSLLAGPRRVEEADTLTESGLESIATLMRAAYDYTVMDLPHYIDDLTMKALDISDIVLAVFASDIPSLSNAMRCMEIFKKLNYEDEKVLPVLNRHVEDAALNLDEMNKSLKYKLFWKIPNQDYATVVGAINQGTPLALCAPRASASQGIMALADRLNGNGGPDSGAEKEKEKKGLLKKLLFRT